jgi:hypothetical protein
MNPEEPSTAVPEDGISRRRMLKRIGAGAAVAWSAPILTSLRTPAFAQSAQCPCDVNTPCNFAIDCNSSGGICNCWVLTDRSGCWCGPFDACSNHAPCSSNADCASGERCIENCCGMLCYAPCDVNGPRAPTGAGRAYGVRAR